MAIPEQDIFKRGSTTYYWSSLFFPATIREDVFKLYSFVRTADNYVDDQPAQPERLRALERTWQALSSGREVPAAIQALVQPIDIRVARNMITVAKTYQFDQAWTRDFLTAMKSDITPRSYQTLDDSLRYVHGSAEVIGLMMARIMGLPDQALPAAMLQGRAMQWINFVRDIAEDATLGRTYFPQADLRACGLPDLQAHTARAHPDAFAAFARLQLKRYADWQKEAAAGYAFIPNRYRIPLQTAAEMYAWTAQVIAKDPLVVYDRSVKPAPWRVVVQALHNLV
jgi:phytoene synthase